MASLPGIIIKVGAQTTDAIQGLNRVNSALGRTMTRGQKFSAVSGKLGKAFLGIAGAASAAATAIGVEAVQAYIDDQKEAEILAKTLANMGFAGATAEVSAFIDNLQFAANVSESDLRPAFSTLVRATGNVQTAQENLKVALDISAGSGLDLQSVTDALAKAYAGNRKGLIGLKSGLDKAYLSSAPLEDIIGRLTDRFGGSYAAQAGTLSGGIEGVNNALDELKESFGAGLVGNIDTTNDKLEETEQRLRDLQPTAEQAGQAVSDFGFAAAEGLQRVLDIWNQFGKGGPGDWLQVFGEWITGGLLPDGLFGGEDPAGDLDNLSSSATFAKSQMDIYTTSLRNAGRAAANAAPKVAALNDELATTAVIGGETWAQIDERQRGARLQQGWADMEARNARRARARAEAARKRAAARATARAKKKRDRLNAVRNAKADDEMRRRASTRTGTHFAASVEANRKSCG